MKRQAVRSLLVICGLMAAMLLARPAEAATYSVQNAGSDGACASAWPPSIVGNYVENGTSGGFPKYDGPSWYIYRVNIFGAAHWVVSNTVGSADLNNSTIAFYQASGASTPPPVPPTRAPTPPVGRSTSLPAARRPHPPRRRSTI